MACLVFHTCTKPLMIENEDVPLLSHLWDSLAHAGMAECFQKLKDEAKVPGKAYRALSYQIHSRTLNQPFALDQLQLAHRSTCVMLLCCP